MAYTFEQFTSPKCSIYGNYVVWCIKAGDNVGTIIVIGGIETGAAAITPKDAW